MLCSSGFELYSIGSVAFRTLVNFLSRCQGNRFGFAQLMLPLSSCYPVLLEKGSAFFLLRQVGRSRAKVSQVSTSRSKLFSNALRRSFFPPFECFPSANSP